MACLIRFYKKEWNGSQLPVKDTQDIVDFFDQTWKSGNVKEVVSKTLGNTEFWEQDLNQIEGLTEAIEFALQQIETSGITEGFLNYKAKYL